MPDFLSLVVQLQREVGVAGAAISAVTNQSNIYNKLVNWIADADEHIQLMKTDWKFLWAQYQVNTTAGNPSPTKPADLAEWDTDTFYLDYTTANHKKLVYVEYDDYRRGLRQGVKTNRKPSYFTIKPDNNIVLVNPPDAIYSLTADYYKTPTKMAANTDVSAIPSRFHRVIVLQAMMWYAIEQEIPDLYQTAKLELHGEKGKDLGLLAHLKASQLRGNKSRNMGKGDSITVIPV